jgi:DUF1009 family protein
MLWGGMFVTKIGIIAGNGRFPRIFALAAKQLGYEVVIIALENETMKETTTVVDKVHWVKLGELQKLIDILKNEKIENVVMAGKITKTIIFSDDLKLDDRSRKLFESLKDNNDDSILKAYVEEIEKEGLTILDSITLIKDFLPTEGCLTKKEPTESEMENINYGWERAKKIAGMDIGQTIVVKNKTVVAVESIEGTDYTIKRGGHYGKEGIIVIKVAKPKQDNRFDVPVIGLDTIDILIEVKAAAIVIDAGKTIFLDSKKSIEKAEKHGLMIVALKNNEK